MNPGAPTYVPPPPGAKRPNPVLLGCIGCGGLALVIFVVLGIIGAIGGSHSGHSDAFRTKATVNERVASERVGGFSDDDRNYYHHGIQHIVNTHQNPGNFTIAQVIDQEKAREEQRQKAAENARYAAEHHDYCADANKQEHIAAAKSSTYRVAYRAAVAGLAANEKCTDDNEHLINQGYLLSMKALAEHGLGDEEWRTDFNQANQLLVECQTKPGLYGTRPAAECETQEKYNISAETNWDIESR